MPAGRPSTYDPAYCDKVVQFSKAGYSLTSFAAEIGVNRDTISEWMQKHPEFSVAANKAKAVRARWWEEQALEMGEEGGNGGRASMVLFMLKNHAPEEFRERQEIAHTGADGGALVVTHQLAAGSLGHAFGEVIEHEAQAEPVLVAFDADK